MSAIVVRPVTERGEFEACVELELATWSYGPGELLPWRVFFLAEKTGGVVMGAFAGEKLVGFNLGLPAQRRGRGYLHSQMLAVAPEFRNSGAGRAMKLAQRDWALQQGIRVIEWTFDPLEIKNSYLNLAKLGAIARRYQPDFYGASTSPLQGGLPTDRLIAEWWIASPHCEKTLLGENVAAAAVERVTVSGDVYRWKADGDTRAFDVQAGVRERLQDAFARGLCATGYERMEDGGGAYLLSAAPEGTGDED